VASCRTPTGTLCVHGSRPQEASTNFRVQNFSRLAYQDAKPSVSSFGANTCHGQHVRHFELLVFHSHTAQRLYSRVAPLKQPCSYTHLVRVRHHETASRFYKNRSCSCVRCRARGRPGSDNLGGQTFLMYVRCPRTAYVHGAIHNHPPRIPCAPQPTDLGKKIAGHTGTKEGDVRSFCSTHDPFQIHAC
jgi:hypothetical protein